MKSAIAEMEEVFGRLPDGREVTVFTLVSKSGLRARVMDYGAILISMEAPDRTGKMADVSLGYDDFESWLKNPSYFGATAGRFGNRIAGGKFSLEGKEYTLVRNNDPGGIPCHLHGGTQGFDKVLWAGKRTGNGSVEFTYVSKDGEEGYPGTLSVKVTYTLTDANELKWNVCATTDAPTVLNIINHTYWNLSGDQESSICDHIMQIAAPSYLPTNPGMIPTGKIAPVEGTPMDFTQPMAIGERIDSDFEALNLGGGYDHCWVLEKGEGVRFAARVKDPKSGRVMELFTDQPGVQFYTGNFIDNSRLGKNGAKYDRRRGFCLETEGFPDSPNQPHFPSPVLLPKQIYTHAMIHKFSAE